MKGLHRIIFRRPVTAHFDKLQGGSRKISLLIDDLGKPITCKGCGYAAVRFHYPAGWDVEVCSSSRAYELLDNERFESWMNSLASGRVKTEAR